MIGIVIAMNLLPLHNDSEMEYRDGDGVYPCLIKKI
jgi:hypothetical protein